MSTRLRCSPASSVTAYTSGTLYLVACADYGNAVPETNESNNCAATTAVTVQSPDLAILRGRTFYVTVFVYVSDGTRHYANAGALRVN